MTGALPVVLVDRLRAKIDERQQEIEELSERLRDGDDPGFDWDDLHPLVRRFWLTYTRDEVLRTIQAHRRLLDLHCRVDARPGWNLGISVPACAGCGATFDEEYAVDDVNDCPVVLALASIYFPESDAPQEGS